jgi:hypothetical protein
VSDLRIWVYKWLTFIRNRKHRYAPLLPSKNKQYLERTKALIRAVTLLPTPRLFGFAVTVVPLGRVIILATYCTFAISLLTLVDAPVFSDHFLDDVAFRAAWLSLTQIPLVYFLSTKRGPVNLLAGLSHERMNWAHRWIGRMLFVSTTTHVVIMKSSISTQDILHSRDPTMSVVRYGIATYTVLIWIAITSILPVRRFSYRIFYVNHCVSTLIFLVIATCSIVRACTTLSLWRHRCTRQNTRRIFLHAQQSVCRPTYTKILTHAKRKKDRPRRSGPDDYTLGSCV